MRSSQPVNLEMYGCTLEQWKIVRGDPAVRFGQSPIQRWKMQRRNALLRGIEWKFSLWDWWQVWQESGHWEKRGVHGDEFVMCRFGDIGPYSRSNVYFATARQNLQDARTSGKQRAPAKAGHGRGYWLRPTCKSKPYAASARGKLLGYFATEEEARAAYLAAFE